MHTERHELAVRWLNRLAVTIPVTPDQVFPTDRLLDHIPALIEQIAKCVAAPEKESAGNSFVVAKARELGYLRHEQHASVHQLLREYELLRNILETFVLEQADQLPATPHFTEVVRCLRNINHTVAILTQTTVDTFVERFTTTIEEQTRRLEGFSRMVSHELRQPLGTLQTAASLLRQTHGDDDVGRRQRVIAGIERSVARLAEVMTTITKVSGLGIAEDNQPGIQRISLSTVAREAARQLREMAQDRQVEVVIAADLPEVTVDVGRLEIIFTNLLSNAIKYSDPAKPRRLVEVSSVDVPNGRCTFQVRDNGLGMAAEQLEQVFTPFYRAHADRDAELGIEGLGLGLSIVRECVDAIGASINVTGEAGQGTTVAVTMPSGSSPSGPRMTTETLT